MIKEFKEFALRGNVIDLSVGVIIGGAFKDVVTSLCDNVIMPFFAMFTGKINFDKWVIPHTQIKFGMFISAVINFIIMAFIIFLMVKAMNKLRRKDEKVTTKVCPYCKSEIDIGAIKCPNCASDVE